MQDSNPLSTPGDTIEPGANALITYATEALALKNEINSGRLV